MRRSWAIRSACAPFSQIAASAAPPRTVKSSACSATRRPPAEGRTVRAGGAGHSFSEIALTNGYLVSLDAMDRVLDVDRASGRVRVEGGITIHALNRRLAAEGLALENLGDVDRQSIAG